MCSCVEINPPPPLNEISKEENDQVYFCTGNKQISLFFRILVSGKKNLKMGHRKEVSRRDSCNRCLSQALFRFFRKGFKKTEHHIHSQCLLGFETQTDVASARHTKKDGGRFVGIGNFSLFRVRFNPGPLFPHGRNRKEVFHRGNPRRNNGYRLVETSLYVTQFWNNST